MAGEHVHLSLRRTGGLAGLPMQATVNTRDLPADEARTIAEALDRTELDAIEAGEDLPAGAADAFHYELSVQRGTDARSVSFSERQTPASLTPLIRTLMKRAEPAPRGQSSPPDPNAG